MPYRRQKLHGHFFIIFLHNTKHNNIVDNFGIYDRIEITGDEIKPFNVHGYCRVSISSIFMNYRENYIIYMIAPLRGAIEQMRSALLIDKIIR
jgi:hypothetical protein